jgi:predicted nucleic acid-binding protein
MCRQRGSFHDILIAASAHELGATLITENVSKPWPGAR